MVPGRAATQVWEFHWRVSMRAGGIGMSPKARRPAPPGYRWIFVKCFKHYRTGKLVYPKNSDCFCFLVRA